MPWLWELPPDHRLYYPLYVACVELGVPFCTQVGHTGPLKPSETGRPVPHLDRVALDLPELLVHYLDTYGRGKVMFGTNWPQLPYDRAVEQARELPLSERARAEFLADAARRAFRLDPP